MNFADMFGLWGGIAGVAVLISIAIAAIGLMVAYVLQDEKLKAWVKNELLQAFYSVCILAVLISIVVFAEGIATSVSSLDPQSQFVCKDANPGGLDAGNDCTSSAQCISNWCDAGKCYEHPPCHIALAQNYLNVMFDNAYYMERELLLVGTWVTFWSNFSVGFGALFETWGTVSIAPAAGLSGPAESIATAFEMILKGMIGLRVQEVLLSYIYQLLFPILLVAGVVFRMFFFTRKLGGLLMAIAISLYFIFPITYVIGGFVFFNFSGGTLDVTHFTQDSLKFPIGGLEGKSDEEISKMLQGYLFSIPGIENDKTQQSAFLVQLKSVEGCGELVTAMENKSEYAYVSDTEVKITAGAAGDKTADISVNTNNNVTSLIWTANSYEIGNATWNSNTNAYDIYVKRMFTGQFDICKDVSQDLYGQEVSEGGTLGKFGAWMKERWRFGYWRLITDALKTPKGVTSLDWLLGDNGYLHNTGKLFVFTVIIPIIAFMVTMASINIMSPLFGGDVEIAVISRLV